MKNIRSYGLLHATLILYSLAAVFSKMAAGFDFLSPKYCGFYLLSLSILGIYAVLWQQVLKKIPLTVAFANKSIVVIWGMIWGAVLFKEHISITMLLGVGIVLIGTYLVVTSHG